MIRKRRTRIIAATAALLLVAGAMVVGFSGNDEAVPPPAPLVSESIQGEKVGEASPHPHRDYGQGYESRHGHLASDPTDSPNHPSEESTP